MHDHKNCNHQHSHSHSHTHSPPIKSSNNAFMIGIILNIIFVFIEAIYGFMSHSLALLADAGHNLSDVAGLAIAWTAFWISQKKPTSQFTFGLRKSSILSALINSLILLVAVGIMIWEAIHRLWNPASIHSPTVMIVASIGIVINSLTALLFLKNKEDDINLKGAYLHMAADALISLGVVFTAVVIYYTNWNWLDPIVSLVISLIIIFGTWDLLKDSFRLSMDAVPSGIDPIAVKKYLAQLNNVVDVHDLHIWAMSSSETALTAHLTFANPIKDNLLISQISRELRDQFKIHHVTIQSEIFEHAYQCSLSPEDVV